MSFHLILTLIFAGGLSGHLQNVDARSHPAAGPKPFASAAAARRQLQFRVGVFTVNSTRFTPILQTSIACLNDTVLVNNNGRATVSAIQIRGPDNSNRDDLVPFETGPRTPEAQSRQSFVIFPFDAQLIQNLLEQNLFSQVQRSGTSKCWDDQGGGIGQTLVQQTCLSGPLDLLKRGTHQFFRIVKVKEASNCPADSGDSIFQVQSVSNMSNCLTARPTSSLLDFQPCRPAGTFTDQLFLLTTKTILPSP